MEELFLDVEVREEVGRGKIKALRDGGFIPAVVYGEGKEAQAIKISHKGFLQLIHQHRTENAVINLKVKGGKDAKSHSCMIKEIQYDPVHDDIKHVDFYEVSMTKAIKVNIPVAVKGEAPGVKNDNGSLEHILWEIEVECLPTQIPKNIEVDVSSLNIGDAVHIKDIAFPPQLKVINSPDSIILSVAPPIKEEEAAVAAEGEEAKEPEVIKEKKEAPAAEGEEKAGKEKK
ncbi:MAG: 50S ribosomal protein L25 [Candidatus Omnitrophica bacterium]|nr:50S ribosomal protein L25 [Candidatus Omnitrophota bacterium]